MSKLLILHKYKYIILSLILVFLFFALVTQFFSSVNRGVNRGSKKEGFSSNDDKPENVLYGNITYNPEIFNKSNSNINTKLVNEYSRTVNLPLNDTLGCQNACYNAKCSKTGKQCSDDVDCYEDGCRSLLLKQVHDNFVAEQSAPIAPQTYTAADSLETGRLVYNQNPQHSALTYDIGTNASVIDMAAQVPRPYEGYEIWQPKYEAAVKLYNAKLASEYDIGPENYIFYKQKQTATGLFYDNGPIAANTHLS